VADPFALRAGRPKTPTTNAMAPATMETMMTVNAEASLSSGIGMCSWL
jgi:hypothetical protein